MARRPQKSTVLQLAAIGVGGLLGSIFGLAKLLPLYLVAIALFYAYLFRQYKK